MENSALEKQCRGTGDGQTSEQKNCNNKKPSKIPIRHHLIIKQPSLKMQINKNVNDNNTDNVADAIDKNLNDHNTDLLEAPEGFREVTAPEESFTDRNLDNNNKAAEGTEADEDNNTPLPLRCGSADLFDSNTAASYTNMTAASKTTVLREINNNNNNCNNNDIEDRKVVIVCENCVDERMKSSSPSVCGTTSGCENNTSIEIGVEECARRTSGCSRETTVQVCAAAHLEPHRELVNLTSCSSTSNPPNFLLKTNSGRPPLNNNNNNDSCIKNLCWRFKDGRLVFDEISEDRDNNTVREQVVDPKGPAEGDDPNLLICEFDVRQVNAFPQLNGYFEVYDELEDYSDDDGESDSSSSIIIISKTPKMGGMDGDNKENNKEKRVKHNPDRDNLRSLLKKPGPRKERVRSNKSVIFNEKKNEFFDADYIILIREECCDYDDEDDDGACTCNQHEMVRLTCCEPNCNCSNSGSVYEGFEQAPQSPKFAPPLEFVDAVTLSPPEGYKDMELGEQQLLALQQMARRSGGQRQAVCRECSASHDEDEVDEEMHADDDEDGEGSQSDVECEEIIEEHEEKEKTDQSQQTTPTSPPNSDSPDGQSYLLEGIAMTTATDQQRFNQNNQRLFRDKQGMMDERDRQERERNKTSSPSLVPTDSPISGILKGGRLWKQQSLDINGGVKINTTEQPLQLEQQFASGHYDSSSVPSDSDEGSNNRRSVRFIESKRDVCDGAPDVGTLDSERGDTSGDLLLHKHDNNSLIVVDSAVTNKEASSVSPESTEMMLTFKLGNHVLISNNSLKPNSAVRQLFPCTKPQPQGKEDESMHQYLVTAESLRAFEEAKRSKLPQIIQSGETDDSIKRTIERNTLRRSLIRYEPRTKKNALKTDDSLAERIKQLTCNVDDNIIINQTTSELSSGEGIAARVSPTGEEARKSPEANHLVNKNHDKSFSPSSSSTASSNSSSVSSTYRKLTDLFAKREKQDDVRLLNSSLPDLGNGATHHPDYDLTTSSHHPQVMKLNSNNSNHLEPRNKQQFLAPLSACVSGIGPTDEYYYHISNHVGERASMASSVGTEYSLEDIDEGLKINCDNNEDSKRIVIAPDVLVGTPSASESGDELAMFVQQDAGRIERIKKKYQPDQGGQEEEDEHDDYGFNKRPSVRGIKPRFGTTTEILQQIQNQLQPPARVSWPYYSESGLTTIENNTKATKNINQNLPNYHYQNVPDEGGGITVTPPSRGAAFTADGPPQYRPTSLLQNENLYQNCTNQRCVSQSVYKTNLNHTYASASSSSVMRVGGQCNEYYQSLPRLRNGRPISPPPQEISKNYHQTMVYIPYNHIEGYQPASYYASSGGSDYSRVSNQNQINKRYVEPIYQQRMIYATAAEEQLLLHHYSQQNAQKPLVRVPYSGSPHLIASSRSESPLPGQFSTARSTQTPAVTLSTCYYPPNNPNPRYNRPIWPGGGGGGSESNYVTKMNRHSFPSPRYPSSNNAGDNISLTDSDISQHSSGYQIIPNGLQKDVVIPTSPTKPSRFIERGVPEGAASVSPQDSTASQSASTMTSPTSPPQNPTPNQKPLFYAMNV